MCRVSCVVCRVSGVGYSPGLLGQSPRCVVVTEAGSYLRLIDVCITQLKAQGPSRTCNESEEEEEDSPGLLGQSPLRKPVREPRPIPLPARVSSQLRHSTASQRLKSISAKSTAPDSQSIKSIGSSPWQLSAEDQAVDLRRRRVASSAFPRGASTCFADWCIHVSGTLCSSLLLSSLALSDTQVYEP